MGLDHSLIVCFHPVLVLLPLLGDLIYCDPHVDRIHKKEDSGLAFFFSFLSPNVTSLVSVIKVTTEV